MADGQADKAPLHSAEQPGSAPKSHPDARASWVTIWQSELAALAADRETQEFVLRSVAQWADASSTLIGLWAARHDKSPVPRPDAPAGSTPLVAAPDARDDAIRRLAERIADLERRLAAAGTA